MRLIEHRDFATIWKNCSFLWKGSRPGVSKASLKQITRTRRIRKVKKRIGLLKCELSKFKRISFKVLPNGIVQLCLSVRVPDKCELTFIVRPSLLLLHLTGSDLSIKRVTSDFGRGYSLVFLRVFSKSDRAGQLLLSGSVAIVIDTKVNLYKES